MNKGELDEYICKIMLVYLRDIKGELFGEKVVSVGFKEDEYLSLPEDFDIEAFQSADEVEILRIARKLKIKKASSREKIDICINGVGASLKSTSAAPPALVNHTARPGFEFACSQAGVSIDKLDEIVDKYWPA